MKHDNNGKSDFKVVQSWVLLFLVLGMPCTSALKEIIYLYNLGQWDDPSFVQFHNNVDRNL